MKGMIRMEETEIMENEDNIIYLNPFTREELMEMMQEAGCSDDPEPTPPEFYFTNTDPYAPKPKLEDGRFCHDLRFDDEGHIVVRNLSAYWLPDIRIEREIAGSVYTVTGSYEGTETLDNKLLRIMIRNMEDSE